MSDPSDDELRAAARNRGLRLAKSRRRKPGGDYGLFGLTDAGGKPLFGFGDDGLTATAHDVAAYLRAGEVATWKESAEAAPTRRVPPPKAKARQRAHRSGPDAPLEAQPVPPPEPEPTPPPELKLRAARPADADPIARLIGKAGTSIDSKDVAQRIEDKRQGATFVAVRGDVIGCVHWSVVETLVHGPIGRISLIVVAEEERRHGIGRQLLERATAAMADAGLTTIEAMSDIEIAHSHGFFRATGFEQTSYRFARRL